MDQHLGQLGLGNLVVVDDFLSLEIEHSEVLVFTDGVHEVSLGIDPGIHDLTLVDFVLSELSVLHWGLDIDFDWHDGTVVTTDDQVVEVSIPAQTLGW